MSEKNVPEVRFQGFCGEWEKHALENLLDVCSGQDYKHLSSGNIPVYGTGGYMLSVDKALSYTEDAIGIGRKGTIDKPYILNAPFWTVDTLFYAIPKNQNDLYYLFCEMQKTNWKVKDESTGVPSLSKTTINAVEFSTPEYAEQTKIGEFFKNLDDLIAQNQKKYDKLVNIKKACLGKMFPKDGADTPEVRFQGFRGEWEQQALGEIANLLTGYPFKSKLFAKNGVKLIRGINVKRNFLDLSEEVCEYWDSYIGLEEYLLEAKDILIQMDGALIGMSYARIEGNQLPALLVQRVTRVRSNDNVDNDFIFQAIQKSFLQYILGLKTETAVPHLSLNDIRDFRIKIPIHDEQKKISRCLQTLDNLITLRKTELEKLKNIKKACLDKMFI